jgi:hypothetical protein
MIDVLAILLVLTVLWLAVVQALSADDSAVADVRSEVAATQSAVYARTVAVSLQPARSAHSVLDPSPPNLDAYASACGGEAFSLSAPSPTHVHHIPTRYADYHVHVRDGRATVPRLCSLCLN